MPIDSNIALGFRPHTEIQDPTNALAKFMQIQGLQQQGDLHRMQADEARRGIADTQALNKLYQTAVKPDGSIDRNALYTGAAQGGLGSKIPGLAKGFAEQDKATADVDKSKLEAAHKRMDMLGQGTGWLKNNPTMQNAQAMINHWVQVGVIDQAQAQQKLAEFQRDPTPEGIARYATMGYQAALSAKDQLPSFETRNLGGTTDTLRRDPVTGAVTVVNSAKNSATPGDLLAHDDRVKSLAQAATHHKDTQGNLEYKQDADGNWVALPKKAGPGPIVGAPVMGADGKPLAGANGANKPLATADVKQLTEVRDNAVTLDRLLTGFKDDFASKGVLGFGADASMSAKAVVGSDKAAVEWWKNYRKQAELVERHAMFGASLTPGEQASWRGADIGPGMDKDVIKTNLATRATLTKKMLETTRQDLIDAGRSEKRVNAIASRGPQDSTPPATPAAPPVALPPGWNVVVR